MGKYGTNLEGFGGFEGGVNADKGAPLVSTSSDGESALLFGPAALREIQAGVANGDFAIPPDAAGDTITAENPLPYWTFTDVNSAGAITCAVVADSSAGSGNVLRWSVAPSTATGKSATLTRNIPVASSQDRNFSYMLTAETKNGSAIGGGTSPTLTMSLSFLKQDGTATGSTVSSPTTNFTSQAGIGSVVVQRSVNTCAPSDAAFIKVTITCATGAGTSGTNIAILDVSETRLVIGQEFILISEGSTPSSYIPSIIYQELGVLYLVASSEVYLNSDAHIQGNLEVTGDIGVDGRIYFDSALTGPYIQQAGTNGRIISVASATSTDGVDLLASTTSTRSGILVTKSTTGQPTTNLNGTGATDAFADVLRNGGIAVDSTNNRGYFYSGGWKYAALTTPSDSRLKEEITDITGALDTLRQLVPVAFKWKRPEAHGRSDAVADDGTRLGFIADQVATTDLAHWVETLGVDEREADLVDTTEVLAVNIPQNEMEALVVQALLDIDARLKALEER